MASDKITRRDMVEEAGFAIIEGGRLTGVLLDQIKKDFPHLKVDETLVRMWAEKYGFWRDWFPTPRSVWQEVSRGVMEKPMRNGRWAVSLETDWTDRNITFEQKDLIKSIPLLWCAALGKAANAARKRAASTSTSASTASTSTSASTASTSTSASTASTSVQTLAAWQVPIALCTLTYSEQNNAMADWIASRKAKVKPVFGKKRAIQKNNAWKRKEERSFAARLEAEKKEMLEGQAAKTVMLDNALLALQGIQESINKIPVTLPERLSSDKKKELQETLDAIRYWLNKARPTKAENK